ncbi:hypothetical protein JXA02_09170 [candidate division KSB1 bacterium]|nr:hypothetical protein [candidate division KSB1 bacterium]RQW04659.1 MAG: hypothetical protein EH222_10840 [candidate division KSB1 bacterium]
MSDAQTISILRQKTQKGLMKKANVIGIGVGRKETAGKAEKELSLKVFVQEKVAASTLSSKDIIPKEIDGITTDVTAVGEIYAFQNPQGRHRPAMPGISIGHYAITAGTFGAVVRDATTNERLILSNNHVLANSNSASKGDSILQPGRADGGKDPQDRIADLERFMKISWKGGGGDDDDNCPIAAFFESLLNTFAALIGSGTRLKQVKAEVVNLIDAAVARPVNDAIIEDAILKIGTVTGTAEASIGMKVKKSGRTTGYTEGVINALDATIEVSYGSTTALFEQQIFANHMSDPGDSGSLIVSQDNRAVGLLFAGSSTVTVINPISAVLSGLNIVI